MSRTVVSAKAEERPREESSVEADAGIPATPPSSASLTDFASEAPSSTPASVDVASRVPSPLTPAFVLFEEFTNYTIFKEANFTAKISLISSLYGTEKACEYFNQVNKVESNGEASVAATSSANLPNGIVTTTGLPTSGNGGPQRKRGFEMDALLTQNLEIEELEAEFLKKRRAHQELLKSMIAKVDVQLEFDKAFLNGTVEEKPVEEAAGEAGPEGDEQ